jgi:hypothetical protein
MRSRAIAILVFASLVCAGFVAPAFAQSAQVQAQYQHYLNTHPELRANPGLINDPAWRSNHQGLVHWLNQHPNMRNRAMWMGDYDNSHQWHNEDWWYHNNPNWIIRTGCVAIPNGETMAIGTISSVGTTVTGG